MNLPLDLWSRLGLRGRVVAVSPIVLSRVLPSGRLSMPPFEPHQNAQLCYRLLFGGNWPTTVVFVPGSRRLAAGNRDGQILLWDLSRPTAELTEAQQQAKDKPDAPNIWPIKSLVGHTNSISGLVVTPDGKTLISASLDRTVRFWDLSEGPPTAPALAVQEQEVRLDLASRKKLAKRTRQDQALEAPGIKVPTQQSAHVMAEHRGWITALGLSGDGRRLITGDDHPWAIVCETASRQPVQRFEGQTQGNFVCSAALTSDGQTAFHAEYCAPRGSFDRPPAQAKIWDVQSGEEKVDLLKVQFPKVKARDNSYGYATTWGKFVGRGFVACAFSPDGKILAVGQGGEIGEAKVHLIDSTRGQLIRTVNSHRYGVCDLAFSADGEYLLSCGRDTSVQISQVDSGKEVRRLSEPRGGQFKDWLHSLSLSTDQRSLAAADIAGSIPVWEFSK